MIKGIVLVGFLQYEESAILPALAVSPKYTLFACSAVTDS